MSDSDKPAKKAAKKARKRTTLDRNSTVETINPDERVQELLGEFDKQTEQLDEIAKAAGVPVLVGDAEVRLVLAIPAQSPPLTVQEAVRAFILEVAESGYDQYVFIVSDEETEYLVNRDVVLNDDEDDEDDVDPDED